VKHLPVTVTGFQLHEDAMRLLCSPWVLAALACFQTTAGAQTPAKVFNRVATFAAASNHLPERIAGKKSVAEIVAATQDGQMLAYTDSEQQGLGLVDIQNPEQPKAAGFVQLAGEPTSVVITRGFALVAVDRTTAFVEPKGELAVVDLKRKAVVATCNLHGQPDSLALDASARHLVVVLENQRDEAFNKGALPQLPGGSLNILPLDRGLPDCTRMHPVGLSGLAQVAGDDPEPEFVKINHQGMAVVTLQENNHIALVDVAKRRVVRHFSAGTVTVAGVDAQRDGVVRPVNQIDGVAREPDAVAWLDNERFVTANEGDYKGGSRGFTIFRRDGTVEYDSGALLDHVSIRLGHYPEKRSAAKGNEPEGAEAATYGADKLFFIASERASLVFVFRDLGPGKAPELLQALPAGAGPEGLLALPQRDLLVVASESDGPARSGLTLYRRSAAPASYPTLVSADLPDGTPIAWGALSGTSADRKQPGMLWAVTDSAYASTRVLQIDTKTTPAVIRKELTVARDGQPFVLDAEGIAQREDGGFWIASEGDPAKKGGALDDMLVRVGVDGVVQEVVKLPPEIRSAAVRFGLEGVTTTGVGADETVWLAVQREWKDDPKGRVKILSYRPATAEWGVYHYPLNPPQAADSWIGLSEITAVGPDTFWVIERDNLFGDQSFKTIQSFSVAGVKPARPGEASPPVLTKRLVANLVPELKKPHGTVLDKVESLAVDTQGQVFVITDNDGVDGTNGETQLLRLGKLR
jgi:Esterase-like activity of phytase